MQWIPFLLALTAVLVAVHYSTQLDEKKVEKEIINFKEADGETIFPRLPKDENRMWTTEELLKHNGSNANLALLLSIGGEVYDVGSGEQHYAKDKGYNGFSGRDASRGWVTGEFDSTEIDGMHDLTPEQIKTVLDWRLFYRDHEEYRQVGKLIGDYYTADGEKTEHLLECEVKYDSAVIIEAVKAKYQKVYLGCNTRHEAAKDKSELWCDDTYHGKGTIPYFLKVTIKAKPEHPDMRCTCLTEEGVSKLEDNDEVLITAIQYPDCKVQHCFREKDAVNPEFPE